MKKILLLILIILILILAYVGFNKGINIGFIKVSSIENMKTAKLDLDKDYKTANQLANITYIEEIDKLEEAITKLKSTKQDYKNKSLYNEENEALLGTTQIKTYTIHYLWTILGNYRKDRSLRSLNIDLKAGKGEDIYDLEFTLVGNYVGITDFIYDIENDEELNFEVQNLKISSQIEKINSNQTNSENGNNTNKNAEVQKSDGRTIQATFVVNDIGITLE